MSVIRHEKKPVLQEIKRLLSDYGVLSFRQINAYFHDKDESIVRDAMMYMKRNRLIVYENGFAALTGFQLEQGPDQKMMAAFWVLLKHIKTVEYHTVSQEPAQIYFFSDGSEYEIVYVSPQDEGLVSAVLAARQDSHIRYLIIVEQSGQVETLDIPNTLRFYTVGEHGITAIYTQEDAQ